MSLTASTPEFNQFPVSIPFLKEDDHLVDSHVLVEIVLRCACYAALIAMLLMIIALIVKLMGSWDGDETTSLRPSENTRLLLLSSKDDDDHEEEKVVVTIYGTNGKDNLESASNINSSSGDLYDGKICVICYDHPINCFFIPCGHCVVCHNCTRRIINGESISCPICRGIIVKVRKLRVL